MDFPAVLHENGFRTAVVRCEGFNEVDDARLGCRLMEQFLHCLGDHTVWKPKNNPLVNRPGPKSVAKRLSAKQLDYRRIIESVAPLTVALFASILEHCLPAPSICKTKVNDDDFRIFAPLLLKPLSLVLGTRSLRSDSDHRAATRWDGPLVGWVALWRSWPLPSCRIGFRPKADPAFRVIQSWRTGVRGQGPRAVHYRDW